MKIGNIELKNNLFLAPMAGYTDIGFRYLCKKCGAGLTCTEMISAKGLIYDSKKTQELLYTTSIESPKMVQLFGNDGNILAQAINNPILKDFDIININMGCPAPKIVKNEEGSFLLKQPYLVYDIVEKCVKSTLKPVTVKIRLGYDNINAVEIAKLIEKAGAKAIFVHGRIASEQYMGTAHYDEILKVKKAVKIPVIANGDVDSVQKYIEIVEKTECDGVMIGRGALGNPWLFTEILNYQNQQKNLQSKTDILKTEQSFENNDFGYKNAENFCLKSEKDNTQTTEQNKKSIEKENAQNAEQNNEKSEKEYVQKAVEDSRKREKKFSDKANTIGNILNTGVKEEKMEQNSLNFRHIVSSDNLSIFDFMNEQKNLENKSENIQKIDRKKLKFDAIQTHYSTMLKYYDERFVLVNMRKHIAYYLKNEKATQEIKLKCNIADSIDEVLKILKNFFLENN